MAIENGNSKFRRVDTSAVSMFSGELYKLVENDIVISETLAE